MVDVVLAVNLNNLEDHPETAKARASHGGTSQHRLRADVLAIMWLDHFPTTGLKRRSSSRGLCWEWKRSNIAHTCNNSLAAL
jgi:hypothetical protein